MNVFEEKIEGTIHLLLYILKKLGGQSDIHKLSRILYFAERRHLKRFGRTMSHNSSPATGESLLSIKSKICASIGDGEDRYSGYFKIDSFIIQSLRDPDMDRLSKSEMACVDESVIRASPTPSMLRNITRKETALFEALNREKEILRIAREEGADEEMLKYIQDQLLIDRAQFE